MQEWENGSYFFGIRVRKTKWKRLGSYFTGDDMG